MLKCWQDIPGYNQFVKDKLKAFQIEGWGGFVLREKLKFIKNALKEWHAVHAINISGKIDILKKRQLEFDEKGEEGELSADDFLEMRGITNDLHSMSRLNTSIMWQQSRLLWLKDGDANSKYFHSVLSSRRRRNSIISLLVDGNLVEGVQPIRNAVLSHFREHFAARNASRPGVGNLPFNCLSHADGSGLTKPFSEIEVKSAVWDCDSYKSPGPDGINFGFIKEFWLHQGINFNPLCIF
jgi:hypothetical protein